MLKEKYEETMRAFKMVLDYPWHDPHFYAAWCAQTYFYSRHVTHILLLASAHTKIDSPKLHRRFSAHAGEEKNHELLAERDAKDLGFDPKEIGEFAVTRGFYATQYYTIQHVSPESLFGWILALEGLANEYGEEMMKQIKKRPQNPTRFVNVHANEDPDHVNSAFAIIKEFEKDHTAEILTNLQYTFDTYLQIMNSCKKFAESNRDKKAS